MTFQSLPLESSYAKQPWMNRVRKQLIENRIGGNGEEEKNILARRGRYVLSWKRKIDFESELDEIGKKGDEKRLVPILLVMKSYSHYE